MKKLLALFIFCILIGGHSKAQSSTNPSSFEERDRADNKLNTRRFEKYLEKHKDELNLTKRQVKDLNKIDRRYTKKDKKLSRKGAKRREHQELSRLKREEMIDVLSVAQQEQLQSLVKKERFSFDQFFGK